MRAGRFRSERERSLWRAALALVALIYGSAYFVQFALDLLRARNLLRLTIGAGFGLAAVAIVLVLARAGAGWRVWGALTLAGAGYAVVALALDVIQERIHLLEYGALALLLRAALGARAAADPDFGFRSAVAAGCGAFALAFLVGAGDEALQGILPNRQADLRDLGLNAGAAAMALSVAAAIDPALARERTGRRER